MCSNVIVECKDLKIFRIKNHYTIKYSDFFEMIMNRAQNREKIICILNE